MCCHLNVLLSDFLERHKIQKNFQICVYKSFYFIFFFHYGVVMLLHNCSDHFFASLKDSQRQFPRGALIFCFTEWIFIIFTTQDGKRKTQMSQGAASGSQLQSQEVLNSSEVLEGIWRPKAFCGSSKTFWIPRDAWHLCASPIDQSVREEIVVVEGGKDSSNHGPLDWMMSGNVH